MTSWIADITAWVTLHPMLAYGAIFLLALSESIPIIGVIVPGTAVIVAVSALVPGGAIQLWPLVMAAFAGAVIGDGLPYWIGHRHHESILRRWPLVRYPQWIAKSESFIGQHGNKSVFLARFTPGVRAFVPLFAGILRMPARRFYFANIGFNHETAEEVANLASEATRLVEKHSLLVKNNLNIYHNAIGICDPSGQSELSFFPLYVGDIKYILVIAGMPLLNSEAFVTLVRSLYVLTGEDISWLKR